MVFVIIRPPFRVSRVQEKQADVCSSQGQNSTLSTFFRSTSLAGSLVPKSGTLLEPMSASHLSDAPPTTPETPRASPSSKPPTSLTSPRRHSAVLSRLNCSSLSRAPRTGRPGPVCPGREGAYMHVHRVLLILSIRAGLLIYLGSEIFQFKTGRNSSPAIFMSFVWFGI